MTRRTWFTTCRGILLTVVSMGLTAPAMASAVSTPAIRTSASNPIPACVTPQRLDSFLSDQIRKRGYKLHPGHRKIAKWYRKHGIAHRVRWDYAFFQMALETNFLSFRRGNGKRGDVHPRQNNFAGLGTTGGGVPGDSYPDASTGVLAQIQHLVVYSGERLANPTGHRTRLKQDVILRSVNKIVRRRPMTFADLAGRWAADKRYGRSIKRLANLFFSEYCRSERIKTASTARPPKSAANKPGKQMRIAKVAKVDRTPPTPKPGKKESIAAVSTCHVQVASFGGKRAVLIESITAGTMRLTAINVQPGFEETMAQTFIRSHAPKGRPLGVFDNRAAAVAKAHALCRQRTAKTAN